MFLIYINYLYTVFLLFNKSNFVRFTVNDWHMPIVVRLIFYGRAHRADFLRGGGVGGFFAFMYIEIAKICKM